MNDSDKKKSGTTTGFDENKATCDLLSALEYRSTKDRSKEEDEIISALLCLSDSAEDIGKAQLAKALIKKPGFETTFLTVMGFIRPFVSMVQEIYEFLSSTRTTVVGGASQFRISKDGADQQFDFDLSNFPRELLEMPATTRLEQFDVELKLPGLGPGIDWEDSEASEAWRAIRPSWDNDFYDDGFHRALSYANVLLHDPHQRAQVTAIAEPILDRLAVICQFAADMTGEAEKYYPTTVEWPMEKGKPYTSTVEHNLPRAHRLTETSRAVLLEVVDRKRNKPQPLVEVLQWDIHAFAMSINVWLDRDIPRTDDRDWLAQRLGQPFDEIAPEDYLSLLESLAQDYLTKLDQVAPVVKKADRTETVNRLIEFLNLPFWKDRWFLYELWTVVLVLRTAETRWPVKLLGLQDTADGFIEWSLGGSSSAAQIGASGQVLCWTQRQTSHPDTRRGLKPDLRLTTAVEPYRDLVVLENKDRISTRPAKMREILTRYVTGTDAQMVWLINYERFSASTELLADNWAGRNVRVISNFRPTDIPDDFAARLLTVLSSEIPTPTKVTLTWGASPTDLDLHAWVQRGTERIHVGHSRRGSADEFPFVELDHDATAGFGPEVITVNDSSNTVIIAVHAFSSDGTLSESSATVTVRVGDTESAAQVPRGSGSWWHAMTLRDGGATIDTPNQIADEPPIPYGPDAW
jgi:hypothetical protein